MSHIGHVIGQYCANNNIGHVHAKPLASRKIGAYTVIRTKLLFLQFLLHCSNMFRSGAAEWVTCFDPKFCSELLQIYTNVTQHSFPWGHIHIVAKAVILIALLWKLKLMRPFNWRVRICTTLFVINVYWKGWREMMQCQVLLSVGIILILVWMFTAQLSLMGFTPR